MHFIDSNSTLINEKTDSYFRELNRIKNDFNVFQYREKNEAWERIMKLEKPKSSGPKGSAPLPDSSTQQFINNFIHIIEMLFPPSLKRNSSIGKRRAEKRAKEMEKRPNG